MCTGVCISTCVSRLARSFVVQQSRQARRLWPQPQASPLRPGRQLLRLRHTQGEGSPRSAVPEAAAGELPSNPRRAWGLAALIGLAPNHPPNYNPLDACTPRACRCGVVLERRAACAASPSGGGGAWLPVGVAVQRPLVFLVLGVAFPAPSYWSTAYKQTDASHAYHAPVVPSWVPLRSPS